MEDQLDSKTLKKSLVNLRKMLDEVFAADTAFPNTVYASGSTGHCAAVAIVVNQLFGGGFRSTHINGVSHWYNKINDFDVDLTGDQFGLRPVEMDHCVHPNGCIRAGSELNFETVARAKLLAQRMGFGLPAFKP